MNKQLTLLNNAMLAFYTRDHAAIKDAIEAAIAAYDQPHEAQTAP